MDHRVNPKQRGPINCSKKETDIPQLERYDVFELVETGRALLHVINPSTRIQQAIVNNFRKALNEVAEQLKNTEPRGDELDD